MNVTSSTLCNLLLEFSPSKEVGQQKKCYFTRIAAEPCLLNAPWFSTGLCDTEYYFSSPFFILCKVLFH